MTLVLLAVGWLAAIATVALWGAPPWLVPALLACFVPLAWLRRGRTWAFTLVAMAALSMLGGLRFQTWDDRPLPSLSAFVGQEVTIEGVVESEPEPKATTAAFIVRVERVNSVAVSGKLRASLEQYSAYLPGTALTLAGTLDDPPVFPDFDYRSYLRRQDVVATMYLPTVNVTGSPPRWSVARNVTQARLALDRSLQRALPEPEAALAGGIAFGRDGNLPDDLYGDFRDTGLAHIVAVSGSNVSLVAALTFALSTWLIGRRLAIIPAVLTVAAYLLIAGLSASVTRAGVMAMVFLLGSFFGRQRSALSALGAAVIIMTLYQPAAAVDIGFQLSLGATAGLIVFGPWLQLWFTAGVHRARLRWVPSAAIDVASLSTAATFATLPLVWINFGRVSLIGPLSNILIEPLFVVAFWLSALTAVAGLVWHPAGWGVGLIAYYPLSFTTWFAHEAARLPFAAVDVPEVNGTFAGCVYALVAFGGWLAYRGYAAEPPRSQPLLANSTVRRPVIAVAGLGLAACAVLPISVLPARGPGELVVDVLNVSDGDAVLITTPAGRHVLIDGGPSGIELAQQLGAVLPHWDRSTDTIVGLGTAPEQVAAWPAIRDRFEVARPTPPAPEPIRFELDGVTFESLGAADADANRVFRISYKGMSLLLAGDLSAAEQQQLVASYDVHATALLIPHHGAATADEAFVRAVAPALSLVPVAEGPYAKTPLPAVLAAAGPGPVLRTDQDGRIRLRMDGSRAIYETER